MTHELNRVTAALLILFGAAALSVLFWSVVQGESLLARDDNARNVIAEQRIRRGAILDREGAVLAHSVEMRSGVMRRDYPEPGVASVTGYYSLRFGTAGIEATFDDLLRGEGLRNDWQELRDQALHRAPVGGDVRLTLDLDVQQAALAAMQGRSGAVVIAEVPSGRVLALVSAPGYDPNQLEAQWEVLTRDQAATPLLNRVTNGLYQPGGVLQTVLLAELLGTRAELPQGGATVLSEPVPQPEGAPGALDAVTVNGLRLGCLPGAPDDPTLAEAYVFGCPGAFIAAAEAGQIAPERLWARLGTMGLLSPPTLDGLATIAAEEVSPLDEGTDPATLRKALAGQGDLTITPLHMLQIVAAIANSGQGVPLTLVDATRTPGAEWQMAGLPGERPAMLRADVAGALRLAMLQAAAQSPAVRQAAELLDAGELVLYGHSALAYSGPDERPIAWFVGFVDRGSGSETDALAVVVVIEQQSDPGVAAQVAGAVLAAASR